ncbi:hypothetical protein [Komagataeibacter sp. SM21]|uniref:hypothetical protein n=1 Tax=Komagataeibacter sp. SM21 TaxID=3242899 RepID=UPI003526CB17
MSAENSKAGSTTSYRAVWRLGRGRGGGSLGCAVIAHNAIEAGRPTLVADGDVNNPTLSRIFDPNGKNGIERPLDAELETSKTWLAASLATAISRQASIIIDMGGGDRVSEELANEVPLADFLKGNGFIPTFMYFTGPERDDFDHAYRIWSSSAFRDVDSILIMNEGLSRTHSKTKDPFEWVREDNRFREMRQSGVLPVKMPALTCMKYLEEGGLTVFDAIAGKPTSNGKPLNPLWKFMAEKWLQEFTAALKASGATKWLP